MSSKTKKKTKLCDHRVYDEILNYMQNFIANYNG